MASLPPSTPFMFKTGTSICRPSSDASRASSAPSLRGDAGPGPCFLAYPGRRLLHIAAPRNRLGVPDETGWTARLTELLFPPGGFGCSNLKFEISNLRSDPPTLRAQ